MPEPVRTAPFLRACLEALREASGPLSGTVALDRAGERVAPTPYEQEIISGTEPRWRNNLRWATGDVATVGWMTKRDGKWSLTDAGETALDAYDEDKFLAELNRRYQDIRNRRARAVKELSRDQQTIADALSVVDPGSWTSYEDLAELVGTSARVMPDFLAGSKKGLSGGYRVLNADGTPPSDGMLHMDHRGMDIVAKLATEGVEFHNGRADRAQRMTAADIQARLADLDAPVEDAPGRRAWLVRGSVVEGRDLVPVWQVRGTASLAASQLRRIVPPVDRDELRRIVAEDYQHLPYARRAAKFAEFDAFCNRMQPGDYVLTTSQGKTYVGRITGEASYLSSSDQRSNLRRPVDWLNRTNPVPFASLPTPLPARLGSQFDVVELTEDIAAIEALLTALGIDVTERAPAPDRELAFVQVTEKLADNLLVDRDWLQDLVDLLWDRRQIILYGPPGTGKTFLARKLASHLAEPSAVKLVQFHPSYTYEDFFEGLRPVKPENEPLTYEVLHGPFRVLVEAARKDPGHPYLLLIDEINRANLAKVFGELYFLLEYRDDAVGLMYSPKEEFTLPENVFLIGTMNTADRSIALVDAAMRRRFAFVELHPDAVPTAGLLARWLDRLDPAEFPHNRDSPALLDALNERIEERDLTVGPSYLMRPEIYRRERGLERVWQTSVLPLLAEHHYGAPPEALDPYRLIALREALGLRPAAPPEAGSP